MPVAHADDMLHYRTPITLALLLSACGGEAADLASNSAAVTPSSNGYDQALAYGLTYAADPSLGGYIIADTIRTVMCPCRNCQTSSSQPVTIQDRVVRESVSGTLDFYSRVVSVAPGLDLLSFARTGFFSELPNLDFNWRPDGVGSIPSSGQAAALLWVHLSATGWFSPIFPGADGPYWADIAPNPGLGMTAGQQSRFIFLRTRATEFDESGELTMARIADGYGWVTGCSILPAYAPK
jgi:hypothetical protein